MVANGLAAPVTVMICSTPDVVGPSHSTSTSTKTESSPPLKSFPATVNNPITSAIAAGVWRRRSARSSSTPCINVERSREDGRRVARKAAVHAPTVEETAAAAEALGLKPKVEAESAHPLDAVEAERARPRPSGLLKTSVVRKVGEKIKEARAAKAK